jgi:hypothetical protein
MFKTMQLTVALTLFTAGSVWAGTIIEVQNKGETGTVLTDGQQARMNMSSEEYVIVDYTEQQMRVVTPKKQQVMLFDAKSMGATSTPMNVRIALNRLSDGPAIAGYQTQKYQYTANGKPCGVIYGSKAAYSVQGISDLFLAIKTMMQQQRAMLGGFAGFVDDCTLADMQVIERISTIGVPMRSERNGTVESEIKSIRTNVSLPSNTFVIPASYKQVTLQEAMQASSKSMAKANQQMQQPQAQELMQQMQRAGQLTPEMMQDIRRAQDMMKQYQQPR